MNEKIRELEEKLEELQKENDALRRENVELRSENTKLKEHRDVDTCENDDFKASQEAEDVVELLIRRSEIIDRLKELADGLLNHTCQNERAAIIEVLASWNHDEIAKPMPTKILNELLTSQRLSEICLNVIYDDIIAAVNTAPIKVGRGRKKLDTKYADLIKKMAINKNLHLAKAERLLKIYCEQFCKKTADGRFRISNAPGLFDVATRSEKFTVESGDETCFYVKMENN